MVLDDKILLGTRNGHLLMYMVKENSDKSEIDFELMKHDNSFSSQPIAQIDVVPKDELFFSLTSGLIGIYKIQNNSFNHVHTSDITKGASLFVFNGNQSAEGKKLRHDFVSLLGKK